MSGYDVALWCYLIFLAAFFAARQEWFSLAGMVAGYAIVSTVRAILRASSAPRGPWPVVLAGSHHGGHAEAQLALDGLEPRPSLAGHRLVVTGSREGRSDVERALDTWVTRYGIPHLVIVGDQRGVDAQAYEWARKRGYHFRRERVRPGQPSPDCFHDRNQRMVDWAAPGDHLLAFPTPGSQGTWDCYKRGQRAGLICVEVTASWFTGGMHA